MFTHFLHVRRQCFPIARFTKHRHVIQKSYFTLVLVEYVLVRNELGKKYERTVRSSKSFWKKPEAWNFLMATKTIQNKMTVLLFSFIIQWKQKENIKFLAVFKPLDKVRLCKKVLILCENNASAHIVLYFYGIKGIWTDFRTELWNIIHSANIMQSWIIHFFILCVHK